MQPTSKPLADAADDPGSGLADALLAGAGAAERAAPSPGAMPARRVVLAEDDPAQLRQLAGLVAALRPAWRVVATAGSLYDLRQVIEAHVPNLLILDVHLLDGRTLDALPVLPYPLPVVLVSGDPAAAAEAFEHAVVDYVLKPLSAARLERALARVDVLPSPGSATVADPAVHRQWLTARRGQASAVIQLADVLYFQAQAKYTRAVMRDGDAILNRGLGQVEADLDPAQFMRVHRSTIINIVHAGVLVRDDLGRMKLQMRGGRSEWLFVSKPYEKNFRR